MPERPSPLMRALLELRRRHLFRVLIAYAIAAWVVLEVSSVVLPALGVADRVMTALVIVAITGFPVVAILTWIYDITPAGIVRTAPLDADAPEPVGWNWRWLDFVIIGVLLGIIVFVVTRDALVQPRPEASVAVLPFTDMSAEGDTGYFGDGMAEAIMDSLARLPGLQVAARTSSFSYRGTELDIRQVAATLGVGTVLEGSVRKAGDRLRISARLIDGRTGHNLWSETFEGDLADIFRVQDRISRAIVRVLEVELLGSETLVAEATMDPVAYDHYLRGRSHLRAQATLDNIERALAQFERALERDPRFGLAKAGLCTAYWQRYELTRDTALVERALAACEQAELEDPDRAETHIALGHLYRGTGQTEVALPAFETALTLDPNNSEAHAGLGRTLEQAGDSAGAERALKRAIELDPAFWRHYSHLAAVYFNRGDYRAAAEQFRRAVRLEPTAPRSHVNLGAALFYQGDIAGAADAFRSALARQPSALAYINLGTILFYQGDYTAAADLFSSAVAITPNHGQFHGNLAAALRMQPGREAEAEAELQEAIRLVSAHLEVNPNDHAARASLALYLARAGDHARARAEIAQLEANETLSMYVHRDLAEAYQVLGDTGHAQTHFEHAVGKGWPAVLTILKPQGGSP